MAQSSKYYRIDQDILLEFIYHDQSNPTAYQIEVDDNGSEVMFLDTILNDPSAKRHLIHELGADVVNFDVTQAGGYLAVENFAGRALLLQNGKSYKFNLNGLTNPASFQITGALGIWSFSSSSGIGTYTPNQNGQVEYTYPGLIGGKITVASKANPLFANPDENTGNDINQTLGRYHAVKAVGNDNKYALIGYDSTGTYEKFNYINNLQAWPGSKETDLIQSQADNTANINFIKYDAVRLHLRSGFSFAARNYQGFLFEVMTERTSGVFNNLTQLVYLNSSNYEIANPKPFVLGETLFAKFIDIKIPTVVSQNPEFLDRFYGDGTANSSDLKLDSNYKISLKLINKLETTAGFDYFYTAEENNLTVPREDEFQSFTAAVEQASDGDYFKIYGARFGAIDKFESYILERINLTSDDIIVLYEVEQYEQIGASEIKTFSTIFSQTEDFSTPILFRPVVMNANVAVNFSIDVTMRIFNQTDNTQIVKRASLTVPQAAKYGKRMMQVKVNGNTTSEIFNILPNISATRAVANTLENTLPRSIKKVPAFVERYNVVASSSTVEFINSSGINAQTEVTEVDSSPYVAENDLSIYVSPFAAYFKFKIAKKRGDDIENLSFDNAESIVLSFIDGQNKLRFIHHPDASVNMTNGEVMFFINEANAAGIRGMANRKFYISVNNGTTETMVLKGNFTI
jgi:hypothetical protein